MLSRRTKIILSAAVSIIALVIVVRAFIRQPVSLKMLGYTTNYPPPGVTVGIYYGPRAYATIGVTNNTTQVFKYWLEVVETNHWSNALHLVSVGTNNPRPQLWISGNRITEQTLLPRKGFAFGAVVPADNPWQVTFSYCSTNKPSRIWKKLPAWLVNRLISLSPTRTVSTEIIPAQPTEPPQGVAAGSHPPTRTGP